MPEGLAPTRFSLARIVAVVTLMTSRQRSSQWPFDLDFAGFLATSNGTF